MNFLDRQWTCEHKANLQAFPPVSSNNEPFPLLLTAQLRLSPTSKASQTGPHTNLQEREKTLELYHTLWLDRSVF